MMEAADADFRIGLDYLLAARRLEEMGIDDMPALQRLAVEYRERANALVFGKWPVTRDGTGHPARAAGRGD